LRLEVVLKERREQVVSNNGNNINFVIRMNFGPEFDLMNSGFDSGKQ